MPFCVIILANFLVTHVTASDILYELVEPSTKNTFLYGIMNYGFSILFHLKRSDSVIIMTGIE